MTILPAEHAARLLEYYIRSLVERSGLRWTEANTADFDLLGELLDQVDAEPELDSIPPYELPIVNDRRTLVLDDVERRQWGDFRRWQAERAEEEQTRRLVRR